jgi:hypothetical protein
MHPISGSALGALDSHRFLLRAALAATMAFAWVFALEFLYGVYGNITDAFLRVILLYELAQVVTVLLTPYAARQLAHGVRGRMMAGVVFCILALAVFGASLGGVFNPLFGLLFFALFLGAYRAFYWTPFILERDHYDTHANKLYEFLIAFMPAIAGLTLLSGLLGAGILLFAGSTILIASLAPLFSVPETYEKFEWGYGETFGEFFEPKYNHIVESAFLSGLQGAALLLLWPLAVFVIVGLSYQLLGLVLTGTLLFGILFRGRGKKLLEGRDVLHMTMAVTSWILRLAVVSPTTAVFVAAYAAPTDAQTDFHTLEQSADNGTYLDEYTVLKEIALCFGRIAMCILAAVSISAFSLTIGVAVAFVFAGAASAVDILERRRRGEVV